MNIKVLTIDNIEYMIIAAIEINNNKYYILSESDNPKNIMARKVVINNNEECIIKLDSKEEFEKVMIEFNKKYGKEGTNE